MSIGGSDGNTREVSNGQSSLETALILTSILACSTVAYAIGHTNGFREGYSQAKSCFSANPVNLNVVVSNKFENAYEP